MAGILVEIAKPVLELLVNRVTEEIHLFGGFKNELNKLQRKVDMTKGIVEQLTEVSADADLEGWLRNIINIIYKAENVFDVLAYEKHRSVVLKRRSKKAFKGKLRLVVVPLERVICRLKISSRIRSITNDFEHALKEAKHIVQLRKLVRSSDPQGGTKMSNGEILHQVRQHVDMSIFIGRESDVDSVVDKLCNPFVQGEQHSQNLSSNHCLHVVAIVGIGGLGKTSLTRKVYENEQIISHFSKRIWISDLKEFNINKILNIMVRESLENGTCENHSSETAVRKLGECLGGKRYLLVLDDVWNTNQQCWDSLRYLLEKIGGSMESMVLTTTRDNDVVKTMHASSVHHLRGLSEDDSWSLFHKIALENRPNAFAFEAQGRKIVEKCKGVPLAIKSIAGLLQYKRNPHEWTGIEESELWDLPYSEAGILPSLKLSYDYLPFPMLKKCFSLCAIWPGGIYFAKYELIDRWIALGLIHSNNQKFTMEDVAEEYINVLLGISFLIVHTRDDIGEVIQYGLHDLVYELARFTASQELFYLEDNNVMTNDVDIRHLTVVGVEEIQPKYQEKSVLENIRILEIFGSLPRGLLIHMKYLRVLCLERLGLETMPKSIAQLKCLKYLNLASNPIKVLPQYLFELYNLQSLILYHCDQLSEIPLGWISKLLNLRHLGLSLALSPAKGILRQLSQLQTLPPLQLSQGGFQICELGCLPRISGKLEIKGLQVIKSKSEAENANLSKKAKIDQLRLSWDNDDNNCLYSEEVLDGLRPCPNLKLLSIKGYGGDKFPSWLMKMNVSGEHNGNGYAGSLCNLIKFELIDCGRCQQLPTMGHLSSLNKIVITNMDNVTYIGPELYSHCGADSLRDKENQESGSSSCSTVMKSFASLKELELRDLGNLVEWCEPGTWCGFPSLEELVIEDCVELKRIPNNFPSLRELTVKSMKSSLPLLSIMSNKTSVRCLKKLHIEMVEELTHIPEELCECTSPQTLFIRGCKNLSSLPEKLSNLVSLEVLNITRCPSLVSLPNLSGLVSLREFEMHRNEGLRGVPEGLQTCKSLETLSIACCAKVETLTDLSGLSRLSNLSIRGMTKMIRQPPDWLLYSLSCLRALHIGNYEELNEFPDLRPLLNITSLRQLLVYGWEKLESIPQQLQLFTNLKFLTIVDFENIEYLPDWLGNLSSLQVLIPSWCKKLKKLPLEDDLKRLTNLRFLIIEDCPLLEEATNINGPEYHKITAAGIQVIIKNSTNS